MQVIRKLSSKFSRVHCNASVAAVYPSTAQKGKVVVVDNNGIEHVFDHVIVATQANHASMWFLIGFFLIADRKYVNQSS